MVAHITAHPAAMNSPHLTHPKLNNPYPSTPSAKPNFPPQLLRPVENWNKDDVQKWIDHCIEEYSLGDINRNDFQMNGKALLLLNESSFQQRAVHSGDILYKALQQHCSMIKSLTSQAFSSHLWAHFAPPMAANRTHLNFPLVLPPPSPLSMPTYPSIRHPTNAYFHPAFHYMLNRPESLLHSSVMPHPPDYSHSERSKRIREGSLSSSSSSTSSVPQSHSSMLLPMPESIEIQRPSNEEEEIDIEENNHPEPSIHSPMSLATPTVSQTAQSNERNSTINEDQTRQIRFYHDRVDFRGDIIYKPAAAKNCRILWEFLYILLEDPQYESIIQWESRSKRIFRIVQADKLAALWGLQKNRLSMTYEKLSRGMRYYYANNIISKEQSKRLLYRFTRSPEEIRKSMRRQSGPASTLQSMLTKKSPDPSKDLDEQNYSNRTSMIPREYLQFLTDYPSSPYSSPNVQRPPSTFFGSVSKSDRSSSSSPESFDSNQDRLSDYEKQYSSPAQSFSSSISSSSTSTKRKQSAPLSLAARLSSNLFLIEQPTNYATIKEDPDELIKSEQICSS